MCRQVLAAAAAVATIVFASSSAATESSEASWQQNYKRAGATSTEVKAFESYLHQQSPSDRNAWLNYLRTAPADWFVDHLKRERFVTRERERERVPKAVFPDIIPIRSCESLSTASLPNTTIDSAIVNAEEKSRRVTASVVHPPATDRVKVFIALPLKGWNGRFQGVGGAGFGSGDAKSLQFPVATGCGRRHGRWPRRIPRKLRPGCKGSFELASHSRLRLSRDPRHD